VTLERQPGRPAVNRVNLKFSKVQLPGVRGVPPRSAAGTEEGPVPLRLSDRRLILELAFHYEPPIGRPGEP
jgi:hypothetical protein